MKTTVIISVLLVAIFLANFSGCAQRPVNAQKIDPILQAQLKATNNEAEKTTLYPCIVYTKTSAPLQNIGVHPDSVFPTFLTARLTEKQIHQLAKTKQVTYIASPKPDQLQSEGL